MSEPTAAQGHEGAGDLADRQQIADALAVFCERIDAGELTEAVEVFSSDCRTDYGPNAGGVVEGRQAFLERIRGSHKQYVSTHHQLGQIRVSITGSRASSVTYCVAGHRREDGSQPYVWLQYHDDWSKTDGVWQIVARRGLFTLIESAPPGFDMSTVPWVPRRTPPW